jgi:hypothetical protein
MHHVQIAMILLISSGSVFADSWRPRCNGESIVSIDLSMQWGPTRCQNGGTCYSFAAIAAIEAALYRLDGKHRSFDEGYAAALTLAKNQKVPQQRVEAVQKIIKNPKSGPSEVSFFDDGEASEVLSTLFACGSICQRGEFSQQVQDVEKVARAQTKEVVATEFEIATVVKDHSDKMVEKFEKRFAEGDDSKKLKSLKLTTFVNLRPKDKSVVEPKVFKDYFHLEVNPCKGLPQNDDFAEQMMAALCRGIPPLVSIRERGLIVEDGSRINQVPSGSHIAPVQGILKINGQWNFVFRDSNSEGSLKNPAKSKIYLPADQLCRVLEISAVTNPKDLSFDAPYACSNLNGQGVTCSSTVKDEAVPESKHQR